jgi:hypothetical protein
MDEKLKSNNEGRTPGIGGGGGGGGEKSTQSANDLLLHNLH